MKKRLTKLGTDEQSEVRILAHRETNEGRWGSKSFSFNKCFFFLSTQIIDLAN